jgi:hypothetical protein
MKMKIKIHLKEQSKPIIRKKVRNAYQKGGFYCIMLNSGIVYKYPLENIYEVTELP